MSDKRWVAVLALTALVAGCGTGAAQVTARTARTARMAVTASAPTSVPAGSRGQALAFAQRLLSQLVVPAGSQPLNVSQDRNVASYTVDVYRLVRVREPAAAVDAFLRAHVPAGMQLASTGLGTTTTNTVTVLEVAYAPLSLPSGLAFAQLGTAATPTASGVQIRADATVSWYPPRSAAEHLDAASFRSVTITVSAVIPRRQTVRRTFTSPSVIKRLAALVNALPATPAQDVRGMKCLGAATSYRLEFTPGVVVSWGGCYGVDVTVNGKAQPRLSSSQPLSSVTQQLISS